MSLEMERNTICRTCLSASEALNSLYDTSGGPSLAEMLMSITPLQFYANDGFPMHLCDTCVRELNQFYTFQLKCLESDGLLRSSAETKEIKIENITYSPEPKSLIDPNQELSIIKDELMDPLAIPETRESPEKLCNQYKLIRRIRYPCMVCGKTFTERNSVKVHMRTHTGEKPYSCLICKKFFAVKTALKHHVLRHTGERPYSCTVCDNSFITRKDLNDHMRLHTGEKPYSCTVCDRSYRLSAALRRHMATHKGHSSPSLQN